jgi:hypothetical protein
MSEAEKHDHRRNRHQQERLQASLDASLQKGVALP